MLWTVEKLNEFKEHFQLSDRDIAKGVGVSTMTIWKIRNEEASIYLINRGLTGYAEAVRSGKVKEARMMIKFYKSFKPFD